MSKGLAKVTNLGQQGLVKYANSPNWDFIYETSSTKNPNYDIGDRVVLPDSREFRYAKSTAACKTCQGCEFTATGYISYTAMTVTAAIGDTSVTIPAATHAALTADELRGGYLVIHTQNANGDVVFRGIIGNTAAASGAAFTVYVDGAIDITCTASTAGLEVFQNPYAALRTATLDTYPKAGIPATYVSAANKYFWVQVKGPVFVSPQSGVGGDQGQKGCFWRHDGSLDKADTALATTVPNGSTSQYAGYVLEGDQSNNGPLFMLQG